MSSELRLYAVYVFDMSYITRLQENLTLKGVTLKTKQIIAQLKWSDDSQNPLEKHICCTHNVEKSLHTKNKENSEVWLQSCGNGNSYLIAEAGECNSTRRKKSTFTGGPAQKQFSRVRRQYRSSRLPCGGRVQMPLHKTCTSNNNKQLKMLYKNR